MFDLKRPCKTCPFLRVNEDKFRLHRARIEGIAKGAAFQCHSTAVYDQDDGEGRAGGKPQQCAGLMSVLHKEGRQNQITQVATRLIGYDPGRIDGSGTYDTIAETIAAHDGGL